MRVLFCGLAPYPVPSKYPKMGGCIFRDPFSHSIPIQIWNMFMKLVSVLAGARPPQNTSMNSKTIGFIHLEKLALTANRILASMFGPKIHGFPVGIVPGCH